MALDEIMGIGIANVSYIEEMYQKFQANPKNVDSSWRSFFEVFSKEEMPSLTKVLASDQEIGKELPAAKKNALDSLRIYLLIQAYRTYGHLMAHVNPLEDKSPPEPQRLKLENLGFRQQELELLFPTQGLLSTPQAKLKDIIIALRAIYCGTIGFEYMGCMGLDFEKWMQQQIEPIDQRKTLSIEDKQLILTHLSKSELLESFLHTKYVGQKRFSLEGAETLVPMVATLIEKGAEAGAREFVLGMAHRGRLNILSNILDKSYSDVFAEFDETYIPSAVDKSGDVKYHKGFYCEKTILKGERVRIFLTPNPSHLESVDPVIEGQSRAKLQQNQDLENKKSVIPIIIHGDAAVAGQGVVYETMQLSHLEGYSTGGTLHIVLNNHIGFTTLPKDLFSTEYCTDIARTFGVPVFHVNAEDPEGCIFAVQLALEIRQKFHSDVFIDLNCYRKYGHNEGDEPAFTQPVVYQKIKEKKSIREIYRDQLIQKGVLEKFLAQELEADFKKALNQALKGIKISQETGEGDSDVANHPEIFMPIQTGVPLKTLQLLADKLTHVPKDFHLNPKLENLLKDRLSMVQENSKRNVDWGMGETLAYATLLWEGVSVRLTGQDTARGTFSHRHGILVDQANQEIYIPLSHLKEGQGKFDLYNSPLSEFAALGFEFGYSMFVGKGLVLWEAQFGDFSNGAQIIIDQYIAAGEQKWGQTSRLTLLLPHGYEGQGPEHSSARIERFLTLAGHENMWITNPTNPSQLFHLMRRQVKHPLAKPLIIFTPKGLLRHPDCVSSIQNFTAGAFQEILDDTLPANKVTRLGFCSGRIYYDLVSERSKIKLEDIAFIRLEQLYPLNIEKLKELIQKYSGVKEYLWVQEEPINMGAWGYIHHYLRELLPKELKCIARERSASPATGFPYVHKKEHAALMNSIFSDKHTTQYGVGYMQRV
jgi:2-oxoglutarate dehydrogenase E1 component